MAQLFDVDGVRMANDDNVARLCVTQQWIVDTVPNSDSRDWLWLGHFPLRHVLIEWFNLNWRLDS